jgi:pilus assembly protein CpaC
MGSTAQLINLPRGSSMAIDLPSDARDVIVPNPMVAEAMLHSPRRITVIGLQPGETDAVVLDAAGRTILSLRIRVDAGVSALQDTLGRVMPGSQVRAEAVNDSIILTGPVSSPGEADRAAQVARAFVSTPEKVINMMTIAGSDQVMVKARVIEVQRSAIKQLGLSTDYIVNQGTNSYGFGRSNSFGVNGALMGGGGACYRENGARTTNHNDSVTTTTTTQNGVTTEHTVQTQTGTEPNFDRTTVTDLAGSIVEGVISGAVSSAFQTITGTNASACIAAFERVGLVRILAEPNLTSVNGESAEFLAGGEFPVPVGRNQSNGQTTISVEFKPFGVRLAFRPIVLSQGRISLQLSTEVSELTTTGAFTLGGDGDDALVIPALNVRRASSTVELPSGGSLMIAGLLREDTRQNIDQLPGVGNLPVLGSLFRSRDYLSGETELVIIIEAYIVSPTSPGRLQTPADGLIIANDAQTLLFGQLNQQYSPSNGAAPGTDAGWSGPVGYVIE